MTRKIHRDWTFKHVLQQEFTEGPSGNRKPVSSDEPRHGKVGVPWPAPPLPTNRWRPLQRNLWTHLPQFLARDLIISVESEKQSGSRIRRFEQYLLNSMSPLDRRRVPLSTNGHQQLARMQETHFPFAQRICLPISEANERRIGWVGKVLDMTRLETRAYRAKVHPFATCGT